MRQLLAGENFPKSLLRMGRLFAGLWNDCSDIPGGYRLARLYMRLYRNRRDHGRSRGCRPTLLLLLPVCLLLAGENFPQSPLRFGRLLAGLRNDSSNIPGSYRPARLCMRLYRNRRGRGRRLGRRPAVLLLLPVCQLLTREIYPQSPLRLGRLLAGFRNDSPNVPGGHFLARFRMQLRRMRLSHGRRLGRRPAVLLLLPVRQLLTGEIFPQSPLRLGRLLAGFRNDSPNVPGGHFLARFRMQLRRMRLSHGRRLGRRPAVLLLLPVRQLLTGEIFPQSLLRFGRLLAGLRNDSSDIPGGYRPARLCTRLYRNRRGHGRRLGRRPAVLLLLSVRQLLTGEKTGLMLLRLASLDGRVRNDRSNVFGCGRPLFFSRWLFRQRFGRSLPLRLHLRKHSIRSPRRALHSTGYLALLCQRRRFQCM